VVQGLSRERRTAFECRAEREKGGAEFGATNDVTDLVRVRAGR
jgi:hypothetical protein